MIIVSQYLFYMLKHVKNIWSRNSSPHQKNGCSHEFYFIKATVFIFNSMSNYFPAYFSSAVPSPSVSVSVSGTTLCTAVTVAMTASRSVVIWIFCKRLIFRYDRKNPRLLFSSRSTLTIHI